MKKYKLALLVFVLCLVFSIALFSSESSNENKEKNVEQVDTEQTVATKAEQTKIGTQESTKKMNELEIKSNQINENNENEVKEDSAIKNNETKDAQDKNDIKKDESKVDESPDFSSIQVSGLSIGKGSRWYFEEYDENGNVIGSVSYDRRKMLEKSDIEYSDGKKVAATFTDPSMIVKVRYDRKGIEVAREEFANEKGEVGKPLNSSSGVYDEDENLLEETKIQNGVTIRHVYTYNAKTKATETIYEDGEKTLFIEYGQGRKTVHIFNADKEISVFDEETE